MSVWIWTGVGAALLVAAFVFWSVRHGYDWRAPLEKQPRLRVPFPEWAQPVLRG